MKSLTFYVAAVAAAFTLHEGSSVHAQCDFTLIAPEEWTSIEYVGLQWNDRRRIATEDGWLALTTDADHDGGAFDHEVAGIHFFRRVDDSWIHDGFVRDPSLLLEHEYHGFGEAIDFHEGRLAVTARDPGDGVVYVYERTREGWTMTAELPMDDTGEHHLPYDRADIKFTEHGIVVLRLDELGRRWIRIYEETSPNQWMVTQEIANSLSGAWQFRFASSIAMDDDRMVIPSSSEEDQFHLYQLVDGAWEFQGAIDQGIPTPVFRHCELKLVGNTLVVTGTYFQPASGTQLLVFEQDDSGEWSLEQQMHFLEFVSPGVNVGSDFSHGLEFDGKSIVVTTIGGDYDEIGRGALYVLREVNDVWQIVGGVSPGASHDARTKVISGFGRSVCLNGTTALVTATQLATPLGRSGMPCALEFDIDDTLGEDFDGNGICDHLDILGGETDLDGNFRPDVAEIQQDPALDCNVNLVLDRIEYDCDGDGVPDDCEADCNDNGIPDDCETDYPSHPGQVQPTNQWSPSTPLAQQLWMRRIIVEPAKRIISELTFHHGSHHPGSTFEAVIMQDPTQDGDLSDAEVLYRAPFEFDAGMLFTGQVIEIPEVELGPGGSHVYIGLHVIDARPGNFYITSGEQSKGSGQEPTLFHYGNVSSPLDFGALADSEVVIVSDTFTPFISAHHGLHVQCCPESDLNDDGATDVVDLAAVIAAWGPCVGCAEDITMDGTVGVNDLLVVLQNWGECD